MYARITVGTSNFDAYADMVDKGWITECGLGQWIHLQCSLDFMPNSGPGLVQWIQFQCNIGFMATSGRSDVHFTPSPLEDAGGTTEADWDFFQMEGDDDDLTGDSKDSQLQNSAGISTGITKFWDEPSAMQEHSKHRKSDSAGDAYWLGFNVGAIYGAQPAFSAVVGTLVDGCNMGFDAGNRLELQVVNAVSWLQRKESLRMPWGEVPCRQFWNHAKPVDSFGLLVLGSFNKLAFCHVAQMVEDKPSRLTSGGLFEGKWFLAERLEADWVMEGCNLRLTWLAMTWMTRRRLMVSK